MSLFNLFCSQHGGVSKSVLISLVSRGVATNCTTQYVVKLFGWTSQKIINFLGHVDLYASDNSQQMIGETADSSVCTAFFASSLLSFGRAWELQTCMVAEGSFGSSSWISWREDLAGRGLASLPVESHVMCLRRLVFIWLSSPVRVITWKSHSWFVTVIQWSKFFPVAKKK